MASKTNKIDKKALKDKRKETPKKISKTWLAIEKLEGTGKILDMKAVLK